MPKTKKTKKEGGKAKTEKKTTKKKTVKKAAKTKSKSAAKKTAKKTVKKSSPSLVKETQPKKEEISEKKLSPEEEAAFAIKPEGPAEEEKSSGREELNRLIQQEALQDRVIFSSADESKEPAEEDVEEEDAREAGEAAIKRAAGESEPPSLYVSQGEEVSTTRRVLLWSSVAICAAIIIFGWFLTIGGSLGLKEVEAEYPEVELENIGDQIINGLEEVRDDIREANNTNSQIEDNTLETIVNEIENSTSSDETVGEPGRDIFNPATGTEEVIE